MLDIIRDLHMTVQNIVAGIALVSQNPGDNEFLRWEIRNGSNQPTVIISYKLPSELSEVSRTECTLSKIPNNKNSQTVNYNTSQNCLSFLEMEDNFQSNLESFLLEDGEEACSPYHSCDDDINIIPESDNDERLKPSPNIFEPEVCIKVKKDNSKESLSDRPLSEETNTGNKKIIQSLKLIRKNDLGNRVAVNSGDNTRFRRNHSFHSQNRKTLHSSNTTSKPLLESHQTPEDKKVGLRFVLRNRNSIKKLVPGTRRSFDDGSESKEYEENEPLRESKIKGSVSKGDGPTNSSTDTLADCLDNDIFKPEIILKTKTCSNENTSDISKQLRIHSRSSNDGNNSQAVNYEPYPITFNDINKDYKTNLFTCNYCKKSFKLKTNLRVHMRIHTGEKPFPCSYCGKCFKDTRDMKRHERIHTGEKPYACRFCNKRFTRNHHRTGHERIHTGEKPYSCKFCGKRFSQIRSKNIHERISCKKR